MTSSMRSFINWVLLPFLFVAATATASVGETRAGLCQNVFTRSVTRSDAARLKSAAASGELTNSLLSFRALLNESPTSLRREDKFVVDRDVADTMLTELAAKFGSGLRLRDEVGSNTKNVTATLYSLPVRFKVAGRSLTAKMRLRKYYSAPANVKLNRETLIDSEITRGFQFLEFKIDHPEQDGVVIKPRLRISDADAEIVQSRRRLLVEAPRLRERWMKGNPKSLPELVDAFLETLVNYTPAQSEIPRFATTVYQRDSYSLKIDPVDPTKKSVEVQLTLDREIQVVDEVTQVSVNAYSDRDVVVEMKVPLSYSKLSDADKAQYPMLESVAKLKAFLAEKRNPAFKPGAGKLSTFRSLDY